MMRQAASRGDVHKVDETMSLLRAYQHCAALPAHAHALAAYACSMASLEPGKRRRHRDFPEASYPPDFLVERAERAAREFEAAMVGELAAVEGSRKEQPLGSRDCAGELAVAPGMGGRSEREQQHPQRRWGEGQRWGTGTSGRGNAVTRRQMCEDDAVACRRLHRMHVRVLVALMDTLNRHARFERAAAVWPAVKQAVEQAGGVGERVGEGEWEGEGVRGRGSVTSDGVEGPEGYVSQGLWVRGLTAFLEGLAGQGKGEEAEAVFRELVREETEQMGEAFTALMRMYLREGRLEDVERRFKGMEQVRIIDAFMKHSFPFLEHSRWYRWDFPSVPVGCLLSLSGIACDRMVSVAVVVR